MKELVKLKRSKNSFFNNPIKIFFIYIKQGNMNNMMLIT